MAQRKPAFAELLLPHAFADLATQPSGGALARSLGGAISRHLLPRLHRHPKAARLLLACLNHLRSAWLDAKLAGSGGKAKAGAPAAEIELWRKASAILAWRLAGLRGLGHTCAAPLRSGAPSQRRAALPFPLETRMTPRPASHSACLYSRARLRCTGLTWTTSSWPPPPPAAAPTSPPCSTLRPGASSGAAGWCRCTRPRPPPPPAAPTAAAAASAQRRLVATEAAAAAAAAAVTTPALLRWSACCWTPTARSTSRTASMRWRARTRCWPRCAACQGRLGGWPAGRAWAVGALVRGEARACCSPAAPSCAHLHPPLWPALPRPALPARSSSGASTRATGPARCWATTLCCSSWWGGRPAWAAAAARQPPSTNSSSSSSSSMAACHSSGTPARRCRLGHRRHGRVRRRQQGQQAGRASTPRRAASQPSRVSASRRQWQACCAAWRSWVLAMCCMRMLRRQACPRPQPRRHSAWATGASWTAAAAAAAAASPSMGRCLRRWRACRRAAWSAAGRRWRARGAASWRAW